MQNVKVIFNDTDYELVKKACQQYDKHWHTKRK